MEWYRINRGHYHAMQGESLFCARRENVNDHMFPAIHKWFVYREGCPFGESHIPLMLPLATLTQAKAWAERWAELTGSAPLEGF